MDPLRTEPKQYSKEMNARGRGRYGGSLPGRRRHSDAAGLLRYGVPIAVRWPSNISDDRTGTGSIRAVCAKLSKPRESAELDEGSQHHRHGRGAQWVRCSIQKDYHVAISSTANQSHDRIKNLHCLLPFSISHGHLQRYADPVTSNSLFVIIMSSAMDSIFFFIFTHITPHTTHILSAIQYLSTSIMYCRLLHFNCLPQSQIMDIYYICGRRTCVWCGGTIHVTLFGWRGSKGC